MEQLHLPHDLEPRGIGALALQAYIDDLFARSDEEVFRILNTYKGEENNEQQ